MNKRETKAAILQPWFAIDNILFNEKSARDSLNDENYKQYISTKGCLLSNLFEFYNKIKYEPSVTNAQTGQDLFESASALADEAKKKSKELLVKENVAKIIREEIKEYGEAEGVSEEMVAKYVVNRRYKSVAIDSMIIESAIKESCSTCLEGWTAKVLMDAHKNLRESLVDISERVR